MEGGSSGGPPVTFPRPPLSDAAPAIPALLGLGNLARQWRRATGPLYQQHDHLYPDNQQTDNQKIDNFLPDPPEHGDLVPQDQSRTRRGVLITLSSTFTSSY